MTTSKTWLLITAATAVVFMSLSASGADESTASDPFPSSAPTTRPDTREGRDPRQFRNRHGWFMQERPAESYRNEELPDDEEWDVIVTFMKTNSPVRMEMYEKLASTLAGSASDRAVNNAKKRIAGRHRDLMSLKDRNNEMYEFALKQVILEDQILGVMREIRTEGETEARTEKFRQLVSAHVDNFLNEREARLERLREMVERETQTIEKDRASSDELIEKQTERFKREMSRLIDFWEDPERFKPQSPASP